MGTLSTACLPFDPCLLLQERVQKPADPTGQHANSFRSLMKLVRSKSVNLSVAGRHVGGPSSILSEGASLRQVPWGQYTGRELTGLPLAPCHWTFDLPQPILPTSIEATHWPDLVHLNIVFLVA